MSDKDKSDIAAYIFVLGHFGTSRTAFSFSMEDMVGCLGRVLKLFPKGSLLHDIISRRETLNGLFSMTPSEKLELDCLTIVAAWSLRDKLQNTNSFEKMEEEINDLWRRVYKEVSNLYEEKYARNT